MKRCWNQFKTKAVKELRASDNVDNDMKFLVLNFQLKRKAVTVRWVVLSLFSHYWRVLSLTKIELLRCSDWRCWYIGSLCSIYSCYCHFSNLYPQPIREYVGVESWNICICDKSIFERENTVWWGMLLIYAFLDMFYKLWKSTAPVSSM